MVKSVRFGVGSILLHTPYRCHESATPKAPIV